MISYLQNLCILWIEEASVVEVHKLFFLQELIGIELNGSKLTFGHDVTIQPKQSEHHINQYAFLLSYYFYWLIVLFDDRINFLQSFYLFIQIMNSNLYPNIIFKSNENLSFIGTQLTHSQFLQILPPNDPNIKIYTKAVQKLFHEIPILQQMLWICRIPSTSIIRVYFSEPYQYPSALCCYKPLFIEINHDFSGHFSCSSCEKLVAKFVYSQGGHGSDQSLFLQKQRESNSRKQNLRGLLTSQRFRGKKLRNNFIEKQISCENGSFIMEITEPTIEKVTTKHQQVHDPKLQELRDIINDIFA